MNTRGFVGLLITVIIACQISSCGRQRLHVRMGDPNMASSDIGCDLKKNTDSSYILTLWATSPDCITMTSEKQSEQIKIVVYEEPGGKILTFYRNKQLGPLETSFDSPQFFFSSAARYLEVRIRAICDSESDTQKHGNVAGTGKCRID